MTSLVAPWSFADADVAEARAVRAGVDRACARIDEADQVVQAFVDEPDRRARLADEAKVLVGGGDHDPRPPLYGVPVGVKDILRVDGLPTRAGSTVPPEALAGDEATAVTRLREAGALVAGMTVTAEFAGFAPGPTRNPYDTERTPGGSSSGSAAAVAAGMVPLALGTQTIGSVVRPAAYCGVVGFKPTYGRIPTEGLVANAPSLDTIGMFTADVASATLAAAALCTGWERGGADAATPALGVPTGPYLARAGEEAAAGFASHLGRLREAGLPVREVPVMEDFDEVVRQFFVLQRYEMARVHAEWFPRFGERYREQTVTAIRQGQAVTDEEHAAALRARDVLRERLLAAMADAGVDLWVTPAAPGPAPRGLESTGDPVMSLPWSYVGMPSVSLPAGLTEGGLPLGIQCVARPDADERLLAWAVDLEAALQQR
ncbi:MAG: amidase [Actinomycetes bacterium]